MLISCLPPVYLSQISIEIMASGRRNMYRFKMTYGISAAAYLKRARAALVSEDQSSLFYAAFELRCCIERRQAEYAEALEKYEHVKIKPWKIRETEQRIRRASYVERIALCRYHFGEDSIESYHTPVQRNLIAFAEVELGKLLHCQPVPRQQQNPWWASTRSMLEDGYRLAWVACQGDSLVPPLWDPKTRKTHPIILEKTKRNTAIFDLLPIKPGSRFTVEIDYLDKPPASWVCDL